MMIVSRRLLWRQSVVIAGRLSPLLRSDCASPQPDFSESEVRWVGFCSGPDFSRSFSSSSSFRSIGHPRDGIVGCKLDRRSFSSHAVVDSPIDGIVDVPLAQTGEGIAECELLKWFVEEGEHVEEFQPLCEVQSDKATIEITSRYKGSISQILHAPGDIVKVGETLLKIYVEDLQDPTLVSDGLVAKEPSAYSPGPVSAEGSQISENIQGGALCTPAVRNLAKQYGININDVQGTGKDGRVLKEDVLKFATGKDMEFTSTPVSTLEFPGRDENTSFAPKVENTRIEDKKIALRGYHRAMFKSMTMAAKIPHFHYVEEIICDPLIRLKASFQKENSDPTIKHTFLPAMVKSFSMALTKYPLLNSTCDEQMLEVTVKGSHNIGIAMATPHGLVVPNIKNVQSLSILEITKELSRLQQSAMENKLNPDDISGGTITISNIGTIGGKFGSPLINVPEVAIIAIGRIQKVPRFGEDGSVYPLSVMDVNIGADHRVLDGATVARFCNEWKTFIEKPEILLLHTR